jgi:hypothetical protein
VVVGEVHGSNETLGLFADAVCLTAQARDSSTASGSAPAYSAAVMS